MEDLIKAAEALIIYIEGEDWDNAVENNCGDDQIDRSQAHRLKTLTRKLKALINNNQPTPAQHLIRRCFTKPTTQRPGKHNSPSGSNCKRTNRRCQNGVPKMP